MVTSWTTLLLSFHQYFPDKLLTTQHDLSPGTIARLSATVCLFWVISVDLCYCEHSLLSINEILDAK